ncbi:MAG: ravA 2 [Verrucomicrobiales bacterium]|nr:ravA 2 [Verrucomicrobiales bacterium]
MSPDSAVLAAAQTLQTSVLGRLKQAFVGKDEIIDLMGVALAAGENLFLLGPPGTAKSALVHELGRHLESRTFDYLLTRFTEPNELFGPFDIRRLREGDLVTNTEGMLPEADLVFLDELLNANSAILNSLLMVLNERVFRRGRETRRIPALMVAGASNHLPEDEALRALFDRFLLRVRCGPVPDRSLPAVLEAGWRLESTDRPAPVLSAEDVRSIQQAARLVDLSDVRDEFVSLIVQLRQAGVAISDRRAVRLQRTVAGSALLAGRTTARISDLWVFAHLWDREEQIEIIAALVRDVLDRAGPSLGDHPRAHGPEAPDPEALASALGGLSQRLATALPGDTAPADELRRLTARLEWVPNPETRQALQEQAAALWRQVEGSTAPQARLSV